MFVSDKGFDRLNWDDQQALRELDVEVRHLREAEARRLADRLEDAEVELRRAAGRVTELRRRLNSE